MVSAAYLSSIMLAFLAVSRAAELAPEQADKVDSKWVTLGGNSFSSYSFYGAFNFQVGATWLYPWISPYQNVFYGVGCFPGGLNTLFAKATEAHSVSRRAISLDADQLYRRASGAEDTVSCLNEKGVPHSFLRSDCHLAALQLADNKSSRSSYGDCALDLFSKKERVVVKTIPGSVLVKAVDSILQACPNRSSTKQSVPADEKEVVMILSKS